MDTGGQNSYGVHLFAQAIDGALLAVKDNGVLVRIAPGQSVWEALGRGSGVYMADNGAGVLWSLNHPANYGDPLTTIDIATYP
jgi:hypothetical protein